MEGAYPWFDYDRDIYSQRLKRENWNLKQTKRRKR